MNMAANIALTCLVTALLLLIEHWLPWRTILGGELKRVPSYIIGVLALALPLSGLYLHWSIHAPGWMYAHLAALWAVIVSGGCAVILAYLFDGLVLKLAQLRDLQEIHAQREECDCGRTAED